MAATVTARVLWLRPGALEALLARLASETQLVAPVDVEGEVLFLPVSDPSRICRDYVNSLAPPRDAFLRNPDRLLSYRIDGGVPALEDDPAHARPEPERVFFGVRSCDVAGLAYLERFLSGAPFDRPDTADAPFMRRREAATVLSVVCQRPGETCMCVCCHGGPSLEKDFDWQLTALDRGWLVEIGSERGEHFAERWGAALEPPPPSAIEERDRRIDEVIARFGEHSPHRVPTMAASRMVSAGLLGEGVWNIVGERCFECGGCAFVCPTCSCFNVADVNPAGEAEFESPAPGFSPAVPGGITDDIRDGNWERVRVRDCCMLAGFVRQAGGGYPRWTCGERCVTRFFHKLSQQFHARMGALGCTGCGRCVQVCLGEEGIDRIAEAMREVMVGERDAGARYPRTAPALGIPVPLGER